MKSDLAASMTWEEFRERGHARVGTNVVFADGSHMLIGDVNESGGSCGCCSPIMDHDVVVSWQRVYTPPGEETAND